MTVRRRLAACRTLLLLAVAASSAILRSLQYRRRLGIRGRESARYFKKSTNFALCYAAFGANRGAREAWWAGEAAFLCCAYDVVTDWRAFEVKDLAVFEAVLQARVRQPELRQLALGLYDKERKDVLKKDGLERGPIALRFTLRLMGCEAALEKAWGDVDEVGEVLQIVDDVLDYDEDLSSGDVNCLRTQRRDSHLNRLIDFRAKKARQMFGTGGPVLLNVIESASENANLMLRG